MASCGIICKEHGAVFTGYSPRSCGEADGDHPKTWSKITDPLLRLASVESEAQSRVARLLIPTVGGYVGRSDWLERRLIDSDLIQSAVAFHSARERIKACPTEAMRGDLSTVLHHACAALLLMPGVSMAQADAEIADPLSWAWVSPCPVPRYRLAIVDGRRHPSKSSASDGIYRAARALDIGLIILDRPNHWLECETFQHLYDGFIPTDVSLDDQLVERIVESVRSSRTPVDGILTWTDQYLLPVAQAAAILGLPSNPVQAVAACVDKSLTRGSLGDSTRQCYTFCNESELEDVIKTHGSKMEFPMVLKPCSGTSSEGVFKVENFAELRTMAHRNAVSQSIAGKYGSKMLVETYVEGPEVDVNMVVIDGEIVFSEISDDFPSPADVRSRSTDSFTDTGNAMPSVLPRREQDVLLESFKSVLDRMGMRTGIFHFEGRVNNSSMEYSKGRNGLLDLTAKHLSRSDSLLESDCKSPTPFVIEINARMPGNMGTGLIERLWGVDYYALYMLLAVRDLDRARRLARPYVRGAQYHAQVVRLPAHKGGVWASGDACARLLGSNSDLTRFVSHYRCLYTDGMTVPDPETDVVVCVAFFYVVSRESREEVLRVAQRILASWDYEVGADQGDIRPCAKALL